MIPHNLSDQHYMSAADQVDRRGVPKGRCSVHYDLLLEGKRYPPKYIISLAAKFASGDEYPSDNFNAVEAKNYFIRRGYTIIDRRLEAEETIVNEDDESASPEGRKTFRIHRKLERDGTIPKKAKVKRLAETGKLECDVCSLNFQEIYGSIGTGFIEAHHKIPVSKLDGNEKTKISDLALVCSNCHRMLHRANPPLTIKSLKKKINKIT
ncbi:HNH endonuclease [Desulfosediminicola sp.]|uniref:HNH endonuclease n=1 Tax=Desulfosediminicola sp. TaxID=2886825 RepID=UPI003AF272C6